MNQSQLFDDLAEDIRDFVEDDLRENDSVEPFVIVFQTEGDPSTLRADWDLWENADDGFAALAQAAEETATRENVVLTALIFEMDAPPPDLAASRAVQVLIRTPPLPDLVAYLPFVVLTTWRVLGRQRVVEFFEPVTMLADDERLN